MMYPYRTTFSIFKHQLPSQADRGDLLSLVERLTEIELDQFEICRPGPLVRLNLPVTREFEAKLEREQAFWGKRLGFRIPRSAIVRLLLQKYLDARP